MNNAQKKETHKNYGYHYIYLIDRSESMTEYEADAVNGFNSMIARQKESGEYDTKVTTYFFDDETELIHDQLSLKDIPPLTTQSFRARGCTALLDAMGYAMHHAPSEPDRKTVFSIITDGYENSSTKYHLSEISKTIEEKKNNGWEFLFLGADIDSIIESAKLGISAECTYDFDRSPDGFRSCYDTICQKIEKIKKERPNG